MMTRAPRLLIPAASSSVDSPAPAGQHHHPAAAGQQGLQHGNFPDFKNCDCHFGKRTQDQTQISLSYKTELQRRFLKDYDTFLTG